MLFLTGQFLLYICYPVCHGAVQMLLAGMRNGVVKDRKKQLSSKTAFCEGSAAFKVCVNL